MMARFGLFALTEQVESCLLTLSPSYAYIVGMADLLGTFEQAVLLAILRLGEDAYGRAILRQVQVSLGRNVAAGAIYTTLDRLEQRGFIDSRLAPGTAIRGGRARRYYLVAAEGKRALLDARKTLTKMWQGVKLPVGAKS
jgi:PadR family transcriptional regulator, regulatory protein PadR